MFGERKSPHLASQRDLKQATPSIVLAFDLKIWSTEPVTRNRFSTVPVLFLVARRYVRRGQAIFVLGLIVLLMYAAVEFLFFIGLMSQQGRHVQAQSEARILD